MKCSCSRCAIRSIITVVTVGILQQVQTEVGIQMGSEQLEAMCHVPLLPHVFTVFRLLLTLLLPLKVRLDSSIRENFKGAVHEVRVLLCLHIHLSCAIGIECGALLGMAPASQALPQAVWQQNCVRVHFHNPIYILVSSVQFDLFPDDQKKVFVFEHAFPVCEEVMRYW